jgi:Phosphate transport regulator (distant homolog of PhoU)
LSHGHGSFFKNFERADKMFRVTAKEEIFFDLFVETVDATCKAAQMLEDLMNNYCDVHNKIKAIEEKEHECDQHVHRIFEQLNKSFITPIDREDIHLIAKELDNITDAIESTAHRFHMLNVQSIREESKLLAKLIVQCTAELRAVMADLKNMKKSTSLQKKIIEVNRIENEGDNVFRQAITQLFASEKDPLEVIKWKEIYEYLENTLDACEDVANIAEGVIMKNA